MAERGAGGTTPSNKRLVAVLVAVVLGFFGFGFALVPLYNAFCKVTGLNGKSAGGPVAVAALAADRVDASRWVKVELTTTVMPGLDWRFRPARPEVTVHPGEITRTSYEVWNRGARAETGRAIMSLSPGLAERYFKKVQCFCFSRHTLKPGETRTLKLVFFVSPSVPADMRTITLSYAFFPEGKGT